MADDKLRISWEELTTDKVDKKLAEREAVTSTAQHYQQANVPSMPAGGLRRSSLWHNTVIYLGIFGALGGLLGWGLGFGLGELLNFRSTQQAVAVDLLRERSEIIEAYEQQANPDPVRLRRELDRLKESSNGNVFYDIETDTNLTPQQKAARTDAAVEQDRFKDFLANVIFYGVSGMAIAVALAIADSIVDRNLNGALVYGSIGAVVGLAGGVVVAVAVDWLQKKILGGPTEIPSQTKLTLTSALCWGLLGLFLAATPGLILRNRKRIAIGVIGGVVGGVIGGFAFVPLEQAVSNANVSRLVAIVLIGLLAGVGSGLIENAVKTGWLRVSEGLIAGKQFVLYRNPTFIGSAPLSHIYLFNDSSVGRRHACIHIIPGAYEIEDLPIGTRTLVNGRPVSRTRLRNGDRVQVGRTTFLFQEKPKAS